MRLVLDTNIYCDFAEGVPDTVDAMAAYGESIYLPSIVLGELHYGFMKGSRQEFNERKLRQIVSRLRIAVISVDEDVARKYAIIVASLIEKGKKIPINDVWVAACCMDVGGTLLTRDRHFQVVEQIESIILTS
ncbi:MAG: type II toxin-antitoxin system VapC family toxin [Desulforhabdus sp.]|nr:type II toxin-antitoxin system VapC family toxin [Desulforhabdus sp.]